MRSGNKSAELKEVRNEEEVRSAECGMRSGNKSAELKEVRNEEEVRSAECGMRNEECRIWIHRH